MWVDGRRACSRPRTRTARWSSTRARCASRDGGDVKRADELAREIREGPNGPRGRRVLRPRPLARSRASPPSRSCASASCRGRVSPRETLGLAPAARSPTALGRTGFSGMLSASTAAYRGISESVFEEIGETVFEKHLAAPDLPGVARAGARRTAQRGHTLAIVSSATRYQAEPLARELGIPHVLCTQLEVKHGMLHRPRRAADLLAARESSPTRASSRSARASTSTQSYFYTDSDRGPAAARGGGPAAPAEPATAARGPRARPRLAGAALHEPRPAGDRADRAHGARVREPAARRRSPGVGVALLNRSRRDGREPRSPRPGPISPPRSPASTCASTGEEHLWSHRPAVFIFNHQSAVDTLLVAKLLRRDFTGVGKQELRRAPHLRAGSSPSRAWCSSTASDSAKAIEALEPAVEALREGRSIAIAPEGTRSRTPQLGRFKKGAFHLAMQARRADRADRVPERPRRAAARRARAAAGDRARVVLPPIDTTGWTRETLDGESRRSGSSISRCWATERQSLRRRVSESTNVPFGRSLWPAALVLEVRRDRRAQVEVIDLEAKATLRAGKPTW